MTLTDEQIEKAAEEGFMKKFRDDFEEERDWDELDEWERVSLRNFTRAALEAVMPGEPVLWMARSRSGDEWSVWTSPERADKETREKGHTVTPLYAHPAPEPGELERLRAIALGVIALEDEPDAYPSPDTERLIAQARDVLDGRRHPTAERLRALWIRNAEMREAHRENIRLLGLVAHDLTGRVEGGKVAAIYTAINNARAALAEGES